MTLSRLQAGQVATINSVGGGRELKARINGLGLCEGKEVIVIRKAPLGGPLQIRAGSTDILMRAEHADLITLA